MPNTNKEDTNLRFYKGTTETHRFLVKDVNGNAFDLTGYDITCQARQVPESEVILFNITLEDEDANGSNFGEGIVILQVPSGITASLPSQCFYDILATQGDYKLVIARGRIVLTPNITR